MHSVWAEMIFIGILGILTPSVVAQEPAEAVGLPLARSGSTTETAILLNLAKCVYNFNVLAIAHVQ